MMTKEQIIYLIVGAAVCLIITLTIRFIRLVKDKPLPIDEMEGHDFEYYCADVLKDMGFIDVQVTKGSGDFGADILAEKDGVTYAVQCKCYDKPIGVKAIQEVYAGRDYYDRMVGVVMTNQYFTQPAVELAQKLNIMLWDRGYIDAATNGKTKEKHRR
jgi:restriction system protein